MRRSLGAQTGPGSRSACQRQRRRSGRAVGLERQVTSRNHRQQTAQAANQRHAAQQDALIAAAERATISGHRQLRAEQADTVSSDKIVVVDRVRTADLAEQTC
jgi:hypothetical protein